MKYKRRTKTIDAAQAIVSDHAALTEFVTTLATGESISTQTKIRTICSKNSLTQSAK